MHNITLICTRHQESGNCNSIELHKLIESISPEIIFEELSHSNFEKSYTEGSLITLETNAIKKYLLNHDIRHIPVDTYDLPKSYYGKLDVLYNKVFNSVTIAECRSLRNLVDEKDSLVSKYGFTFLNSNQNDVLFEKISSLEEKILDIIRDENLFRVHELKKEVTKKREDEIIRNIYHFSKGNPYKQAILFIGSGHRKSIMKKIEEYKMQKGIQLNWIL